jgi:dolichol-phosphate mannosyltransferase
VDAVVGRGRVAMKRSPVEGNLGVDSDVGVILPTYCEVANIERIVQEIENLNLNTTILVIDDSSPDRTADTVRALQKRYENVLLLVRPRKSGLGTAITDGFRVFLSLQNPPKCIVTMDADYSHNPKEIPRLIAPTHDAYDLIVGSRYYRGGSTRDWGIVRLAISKIANLITKYRIAAGIHDYTSGMRCYSTRVVRSMINDLHSQTYEIQIETIRQANLRRFKLKEVPITFVNRKKGKSKLSLNEIRDFLSYIMSIGRRC